MNSRTPSIDELLAEACFLRRIARGLASDADADDLVQDTFVAALEHPPRQSGSIRGWLSTVAANLSRNASRARRRREFRELAVAREEPSESDEISHDRIEVQRALFQMLLTLPAEQRTVVYLRYYEERTPTWIAEHLGVNVKTVKSRHTRAMASLRERLDARSNGDRRVWLEALAPLSGTHGSGTTVGVIGGLLVKKLVVVGVAMLLLALAWLVIPHSLRVNPASKGNGESVAAVDAPVKPPLAPVVDAPAAAREAAAEHVASGTGALEVHLSWSDGTPAAAVGLEVQCENDPAPRDESFRAITDAAGVAKFPALFAGKVQLTPDMRERFEAEVEAGATRTVAHTFERGIEVRGHVLDTDGAPVATASVWCKGADWNTAVTFRVGDCAADGSFRLRDLSARAFIGGRARHFRPSTCTPVDKIAAGPSGAREVEFRLGPSGGRVRGQVLDPESKPVEHALVMAGERGAWSVNTEPGRSTPQPGAVETDKDGQFELFDDFAPGTQPIFACARGYPVWEGHVDVVADSTTSIEIKLERSARIEGRVIGLDGKPAAGMRVRASKEDRGGWYWDMFPAAKSTSDTEGKFVLGWIAPGAREIDADDYLHPEVGRGQTTVTCTAGETTTVELKLERGNTISGHVSNKSGAPLVGWSVYSETSELPAQWYSRRAKTTADGSFTLINLGPGKHDLLVRGPVFSAAPRAEVFRVPVGTQDVAIVVEDAGVQLGSFRARLIDSKGRSLEDLEVTSWKTSARTGTPLELDPKTGVVQNEEQPGKYRIGVYRGGVELFVSNEFTVVENELTDVGDLTLGELGRVEIEVQGLPPNLASMHLSLEGPGRLSSGVLVWDKGTWRSKDIAAGHWIVMGFQVAGNWVENGDHSALWLRGAEIEVPPGETAHVVLVAERARQVELRFNNSGEGWVTVAARDSSGKLLLWQSVGLEIKDNRSSLTIALPTGHATIEVTTREALSGQVEVDVGPSLNAPVEIVLR
jgi:RNA polymerase sigma factor (sigma-70 family)